MILLSPDCRDGNHRRCYGEAWDEERDEQSPCGCTECPCGDRPAENPQLDIDAEEDFWDEGYYVDETDDEENG